MIDSTINLINLVFIVGMGSLIFAILWWWGDITPLEFIRQVMKK